MKRSFDATPSDGALRSEDGWIDMDVRWLLTRESVGAEHSVFGITVFPAGSKHDIHRHPNAEEFEYLVSGHGIARVGDDDVELGPGERRAGIAEYLASRASPLASPLRQAPSRAPS